MSSACPDEIREVFSELRDSAFPVRHWTFFPATQPEDASPFAPFRVFRGCPCAPASSPSAISVSADAGRFVVGRFIARCHRRPDAPRRAINCPTTNQPTLPAVHRQQVAVRRAPSAWPMVNRASLGKMSTRSRTQPAIATRMPGDDVPPPTAHQPRPVAGGRPQARATNH